MSTMARNKGKRGEREIADLFIELMKKVERKLWKSGYSDEVKRNTLQSDRGGYDLVGIPGLAIEIKRQETLNINTWWKQTLEQAKGSLMPVLIYRQNNKPWKVRTMVYLSIMGNGKYVVSELSIDDFLSSYEIYYNDLISQQTN
jgi:hypothetical protein